jgi:hypothetical protein
MGESHDYEAGKNEGNVEGKLDAIDRSLTEFKQGMWKRVEKLEEISIIHATTIVAMKESVEDYRDSKRWFIRIVLGTVIVALLGLVIVRR